MDPLSIAVSLATLIGTITQVLGYLNDVKTASKERAKLASEVASLLALLTSMRYKAEEAEQEQNEWYNNIRSLLGGANGPLEQFKSALEELAGILAPAAGTMKFGRKLIWTLNKRDCIDILNKIERLKTLIGLAMQEDHFKLAQAIKADTASIPAIDSTVVELKKGLQGLQLGEDAKLRREIVEWLSPLNFFATQDDIFSRRQSGTGQWLLESSEFKDWLSGSIKILWCPGIPGAGKTILASVVVNQLHKQFTNETKIGIACIYCNYKEKDAQTPVNLIASLWMQLVKECASLSTDLKDLHEKCMNRGTRPSLTEVSKILQSEITRYTRVFIVIDALDEYSESDGTRQLFLAEIRKLTPNISLLITSRDLTNIGLEFPKADRLEIRANDADVRNYLKSRIEGQPRLVRYIKKDAALQDIILDTIVEKANGMFLLAQLHMDSLAREDNLKAIRRALKNLPEELDETYDNAMQRIQSQNRQQVRRAEQVLSWISYALRPLSIREIQCALAVEPEDTKMDEEALPDEDILVSVCAGLVTIDRESSVIRLVHYTTQEYFQRVRIEKFPNAQTEIARICITYLLFDVFAEGPCSSYEQMETRLHENPLLHYAALHWGDHARGDPEEKIQELILKLFGEKYKLSCIVQVMYIPDSRYKRYTQNFPRDVTGLHIAASFNLEKITSKLLEIGVDAAAVDSRGRTALHFAAKNGRDVVAKLLLENRSNIEAEDSVGKTPLHFAAQNGHDVVVKLLLENGSNIEAEASDRWTALHFAADSKNEAVVKLLLKNGADVKAEDSDRRTALHLAAEWGDEAVVKLLLENGANVKAEDSNRWTALHLAARSRNELVMKLLLENGADVRAETSYKWTALHLAAESGEEAVVKLLLENGADVRAEDSSRWIALHLAARSGGEAVVRLLLENGADVKAEGSSRWTALHLAARSGDEAVARLLLENGADVKAETNDRWTALHSAAVSGNEAVVKLLLGNGSNIEAEDGKGMMPLHFAAENGNEAVVKLLLENRADVKAEGSDGWTALHLAAKSGNMAVVKLLLKNGSNIEAKDIFGITPLHLAANNRNYEAVKQLLENGANVKAETSKKWTALHFAAETRNKALVELLLEKGANTTAADEEGLTALHLAAKRGNKAVVRLLLKYGADATIENKDRSTALQLAAKHGHKAVEQLLILPR